MDQTVLDRIHRLGEEEGGHHINNIIVRGEGRAGDDVSVYSLNVKLYILAKMHSFVLLSRIARWIKDVLGQKY